MNIVDEIKEKLRNILLSIVEVELDSDKIKYDANIVEMNILNSITFIKLVSAIETEFNIEYEIEELALDSFNTISQVADDINRKMKERGNE